LIRSAGGAFGINGNCGVVHEYELIFKFDVEMRPAFPLGFHSVQFGMIRGRSISSYSIAVTSRRLEIGTVLNNYAF